MNMLEYYMSTEMEQMFTVASTILDLNEMEIKIKLCLLCYFCTFAFYFFQ